MFRKKRAEDDDFKLITKRVLGDNAELMGVYKPRTQETKQTYEVILAFIQEALGDQVCIFYPPWKCKSCMKIDKFILIWRVFL